MVWNQDEDHAEEQAQDDREVRHSTDQNSSLEKPKSLFEGIKGRWKGVSAGQVMDMMSIS